RRHHSLLRRDELDVGLQPATQRVDGFGLALQLLCEFAELLDLAPIDGLEQRLARREVTIERTDTDTGPLGDRFKTRVRAARAEDRLRRFQHALAIADCVGARPPGRLCGPLPGSHFLLIVPLLKTEASSV